MAFICYRKSLIVTCTDYRARRLSLGHKSDFSVLVSRSPLTTALTLWHQPLMQVTALCLLCEKLTWKICSPGSMDCTLYVKPWESGPNRKTETSQPGIEHKRRRVWARIFKLEALLKTNQTQHEQRNSKKPSNHTHTKHKPNPARKLYAPFPHRLLLI